MDTTQHERPDATAPTVRRGSEGEAAEALEGEIDEIAGLDPADAEARVAELTDRLAALLDADGGGD